MFVREIKSLKAMIANSSHIEESFSVLTMYTNGLLDYTESSCNSHTLGLHHLTDSTVLLAQDSSTVDADSIAEGLADLCGELLPGGDERGRQFAHNSVTEVCRSGFLLL